jgi:capsular exopolysaccharide synthesis family protein
VELTNHLRLIWASKRWLALFAIAAALATYAISSSRSDQYESKALGQIVSTSQAAGEILDEEQLLSLSNLYDKLAKSRTVLARAHQDQAVKGRTTDFDASIEVQPEARVGVLAFVATTGDPTESAEFANAYANAFARYLEELSTDQRKATLRPLQERIDEINSEITEASPSSPKAAGLQVELQALQDQIAIEIANPGDTIRVIEPAAPPLSPASPRPLRDAVLVLIGALVLGASAIYLRDIFFDRYRSAEEAVRDLGLPLLGEIPKERDGPALESFRSLRTAVVLMLEHPDGIDSGDIESSRSGTGTLLVTGAESGCGKSYVAANISQTLAAEGRRVATVDGDLRRPTLHETFGAPPAPGLSDLLLTEEARSPADAMVSVNSPDKTGVTGELQLMPAGSHASESVESLSSAKMRAIVQFLQSNNDIVVFDSPPTLVVVDPVVLARYASGVLFVIDSRHTRRRDARRAIEALRAIGAPLLGFAFNRSSARQTRYDAYRPRHPGRQVRQPEETRV